MGTLMEIKREIKTKRHGKDKHRLSDSRLAFPFTLKHMKMNDEQTERIIES